VGIQLSFAGIALVLLMRLPLAVLGNTGTDEEIALFSAAQRFGDAAILLATTSGFALLPGIAYLASAEPARARGLLRRALITAAAVGAALALVALPTAEPVMRVLFGPDFADGANLLRIVAAGMPGYALLGVAWYALVAFHGEARLLLVGLASLPVAVLLCVVLVPNGAEGAAWTYVASLCLTAGLTLLALERQLRGSYIVEGVPAPPRSELTVPP
jgi:O-antigen/teichoic acid export membrane protein